MFIAHMYIDYHLKLITQVIMSHEKMAHVTIAFLILDL